MALTRKFLEWTCQPLKDATRYLAGRFADSHQLDLSQVDVVLPGRRACRQFLKQLAIFSDQQQLILFAPRTLTPGQFPEQLYCPDLPLASELEQKFAWAKALRAFKRSGEEFIVPPTDESDVTSWLDLAELFHQTHQEIASAGLNFSDVVVVAQKIPGFSEIQRWKFFDRVQQRYFQILKEFGLCDLQTARKQAIDRQRCQTNREIILLGMVDMNPMMIQMLEQIRDRVTCLVLAPDSLSDHFDHFGNLLAHQWETSRTNIEDEQMVLVEGAEDQANCLIDHLNQWQNEHAAGEIAIGVGDPTIVRQLQSQLAKSGVDTHWVGGTPLTESQPFQLLWALAAYIEGQRFYEFAALVRHPIVSGWIDSNLFSSDSLDGEGTAWLSQLDQYFQKHLQPKLGFWLGPESEWADIRKINDAIEGLVAPLIRPRYRKFNEWAAILAQVIVEFFRDVQLDPENATDSLMIHALDQIRNVLFEVRSIPEALAPNGTAADTLQLVLSRLQKERLPARRDPEMVEMLGWLELPLDESPMTLVTSMNDEYIPLSKNEDAMLPNTLRSRLGITDNSRRYSRDNYFLNLLRSSRKVLRLLVAKKNREGEPLTPSRLLFAASRKTLPERVLRMFGSGEKLELKWDQSMPIPDTSRLRVPRPRQLDKPPTSISVTAFRTYLACPYLFYLKHVERLEPLDDQVNELSPPSFGNAIHEVLERFGNSEFRQSSRSGPIRDFLDQQLDEYFLRMFGKLTLPAVDIQKEQSRQRLHVFADWQAEWASQGWEIVHNELKSENVQLRLDDGRSIELRGRIDRMDYHPETNVTAILDYKTGDRETSPKQKHRDANGNWIDLQLPLYRTIARSMDIPGPYRFGYVALPKDLSLTGAYFADWTDPELDEAEALALQIVEQVLDQQFWPPASEHRYRKDFAAICQDHVLDRQLAEDESGEFTAATR